MHFGTGNNDHKYNIQGNPLRIVQEESDLEVTGIRLKTHKAFQISMWISQYYAQVHTNEFLLWNTKSNAIFV